MIKEIKPRPATKEIAKYLETIAAKNKLGTMAAIASVEFYRDGTATVDWCGDCNHIELLGSLRWMEEHVLDFIRKYGDDEKR